MSTTTTTTERPILFSAPMVNALLAGTKTQTRRIVKPSAWFEECDADECGRTVSAGYAVDFARCPYGAPGERLWVRETWRTTGDGGRCDDMKPRDMQPHAVWYDADGAAPADEATGKTRVSIHMPRWACRIVVAITDVRVQRLQEISEDDAKAEGIIARATCYFSPTRDGSGEHAPDPQSTARSAFAQLWDDVNGHGSWDANPLVWAISFRRVTP